jgi:homopolymeric O-antigen transport system ATP-binding protein
MSDIAIQMDHLSKRYRLGVIGGKRLVDDVNQWWAKLRSKPDPLARIGSRTNGNGVNNTRDTVLALDDISLNIKRGEVLGIIGRNGAGKSTLLKILSRVTAPTTGEVRVKGRIAALLEVGTGFHPDLTGRENAFLNGSILGMTKAEIRRKFDEIVAFSGVERFIDTPVKRYSSGMFVRLAFSVAAHLDPEILIVDEVLSVGDAAFRQKCLGKMQTVNRSEGRTVLFVSHDMASIDAVCSRGIVLESGKVAFDGPTAEAVSHYLSSRALDAVVDDLEGCTRQGSGGARILSIRFEDDEGNLRTHFRMGEAVNMIVRADLFEAIENPTFAINLLTDTGTLATACLSSHYGFKMGVVKGLVEYRMRIGSLSLYPRTYIVEPYVADSSGRSNLDWVRDAARFAVTLGPDFMGGAIVNSKHGISYLRTEWDARRISDGASLVKAPSVDPIDSLRATSTSPVGSMWIDHHI